MSSICFTRCRKCSLQRLNLASLLPCYARFYTALLTDYIIFADLQNVLQSQELFRAVLTVGCNYSPHALTKWLQVKFNTQVSQSHNSALRHLIIESSENTCVLVSWLRGFEIKRAREWIDLLMNNVVKYLLRPSRYSHCRWVAYFYVCVTCNWVFNNLVLRVIVLLGFKCAWRTPAVHGGVFLTVRCRHLVADMKYCAYRRTANKKAEDSVSTKYLNIYRQTICLIHNIL